MDCIERDWLCVSREGVIEAKPRWWWRVWQRVQRWRALQRERAALYGLSDAALKDLGLSRYDVDKEAQRPFWDDPLRK